MNPIIIFSGTSEGKNLAKILSDNRIETVVCVATEYGQSVMPVMDYVSVHQGRMTYEEMTAFFDETKPVCVVDATHPFATVVSQNIKSSAHTNNIPYLRLKRDTEITDNQNDNCVICSDVEDCIRKLENTSGNILLTTGSKDLHRFTSSNLIKDRLYVRVLPNIESIELCRDAGIEGKKIIAMQGPFSEEMNIAMINQYNIQHLVTKESGKVGGVVEKMAAIQKTKVGCFVIGNPDHSKGFELYDLLHELSTILKIEINVCKNPNIILVGIGSGQTDNLTIAGKDAIDGADVIFGASRLLSIVPTKKRTFPYYLASDIMNELEKEYYQNVVILFSGDTGFYSGCTKLRQAFIEKGYERITVIPGISSVSALSAKTGIPYQDAMITSIHGKENWKQEFLHAVVFHEKVFMLFSNVSQCNQAIFLLKEYRQEHIAMYIGYQLSYHDEEVTYLSVEEYEELSKDGLYVILFLNSMPKNRELSYGKNDDDFLRDKVPMTKEEIREIILSKLCITENSVLYDVGSGTGSIAIEMALMSPKNRVYAIEQKEEAVALIAKNKNKFLVDNLEIIHAFAPMGLEKLPSPNSVFIGGSKGNLYEILQVLQYKNPALRVVISAISLETIQEIMEIEKIFFVKDFSVSYIQVSKSRQIGTYHLMQAENPIMICSFYFDKDKIKED